ncbi:MAG TPA: M23 family metallopeptidase [Planctomycetota bacterium]|nr:M23 family metallopeptidase [Planctomycetota bacterium]
MIRAATPALALLAAALLAPFATAQRPADPATPAQSAPGFELPCTGYRRGLRAGGNFGVHIDRKESPFHDSWHLAEDVWLPAGTPVRCVADGVVRYSDWSPSWKDEKGRTHWNLGNVIVVEHALDPPVDGMRAVCSFYVHLGKDRRAQVGDRVRRGQQLAVIGADRSAENGLYPAHLHFGLHRGPYVQIPPSLRRELEAQAKAGGIVLGGARPIRGEIELVQRDDDAVLVRSKADGASIVLSLLVGSTSPGHVPADIMCWCEGYGDEATVGEWLRPSTWIEAHPPR